MNTSFEWDENKNSENLKKHGVDFETAQYAFIDPKRVIAEDTAHGKLEKRYYAFGKVKGGVLTVRFTYRGNRIRIRIKEDTGIYLPTMLWNNAAFLWRGLG